MILKDKIEISIGYRVSSHMWASTRRFAWEAIDQEVSSSLQNLIDGNLQIPIEDSIRLSLENSMGNTVREIIRKLV